MKQKFLTIHIYLDKNESEERISMTMQTSAVLKKTELREIIKEAVTAVLTERSDLLEDAFSEALLDMKLGLAMEKADTGEYIPEDVILSKLSE